MKNSKRFWVLLMAALMALALVACGNSNEPTPTPDPTPEPVPQERWDIQFFVIHECYK